MTMQIPTTIWIKKWIKSLFKQDLSQNFNLGQFNDLSLLKSSEIVCKIAKVNFHINHAQVDFLCITQDLKNKFIIRKVTFLILAPLRGAFFSFQFQLGTCLQCLYIK